MTSKYNLLRSVVICLSCFAFQISSAQNKKSNCSGVKDTLLHKFVYKLTDKMPEPKGGLAVLFKQISKDFKYPQGEADYNGRVLIAFVVEPNGQIDGERTIYDPSGKDNLFGKQLYSIIKKVTWQPGLCNGKPVPILFTLPLRVDIQE